MNTGQSNLSLRRFLAVGTAAVSGVILPAATALAQTQPTTPPYFYGHGWMWGGHWFLGPLWLVVVVGVIAIVARMASRRHAARGYPTDGRAALDILRERFARGEIDKNEFDERRRVLGG
jgi:putative membrane protein